MHESIEIGKVPGKVMSEYFKSKVESLTARFQDFAYENTAPPKKKKTEKGDKSIAQAPEVPDSYFKVNIQFFKYTEPSGGALAYPPIGKHITTCFLYYLLHSFTF